MTATASLNVCVAASIVLHHFATWANLEEQPRSGEKFIVNEVRMDSFCLNISLLFSDLCTFDLNTSSSFSCHQNHGKGILPSGHLKNWLLDGKDGAGVWKWKQPRLCRGKVIDVVLRQKRNSRLTLIIIIIIIINFTC